MAPAALSALNSPARLFSSCGWRRSELPRYLTRFRASPAKRKYGAERSTHAVASIDWAVSNLPSFETKIDDWLRDNVYADVIDIQGNTADQMVVAVENELLPLSFVVEAGAYINANLERHRSHFLKAAICPDPFPEDNPSTATRQRPQSCMSGTSPHPSRRLYEGRW
jgi:hypothetical protein